MTMKILRTLKNLASLYAPDLGLNRNPNLFPTLIHDKSGAFLAAEEHLSKCAKFVFLNH